VRRRREDHPKFWIFPPNFFGFRFFSLTAREKEMKKKMEGDQFCVEVLWVVWLGNNECECLRVKSSISS
jgi:hypothetical protein